MDVLALLAGIGGLELGVQLAVPGARVVCAVERQAFAAACLARHQVATGAVYPVWDDLSTFDGTAWRGCVDLVTAGIPCQPFSVAGQQRGTEDERWLWPEVFRILRESESPAIFLECTPGLRRLGLPEILRDLAELGLDAVWSDQFSAESVGAPHKRRRFFLLARRVPDAGRIGLWQEPGRREWSRDGAGTAEPGAVGAEAVAHGHGDGFALERGSSVLDGFGPARGDDADRCGQAVGDANRSRLEGRQQPERSCHHERATWPPGPTDHDSWKRWLDAGGPAPTEPSLRRGTPGAACGPERSDRLHALGNGVVPLSAAMALRTLAARAVE